MSSDVSSHRDPDDPAEILKDSIPLDPAISFPPPARLKTSAAVHVAVMATTVIMVAIPLYLSRETLHFWPTFIEQSEDQSTPEVKPPKEDAETRFVRESDQALRFLSERKIQQRNERVTLAFENLAAESKQWRDQILPLLANEDGSRLAACGEKIVQRCRVIFAKGRLNEEEIKELRKRCDILLKPLVNIDRSTTSLNYSSDVELELNQLLKRTQAAADSLHEDRQYLQRQIAVSPNAVDLTLRDAMKLIKNHEYTRQLDQRGRSLEQSRQSEPN